MSGSVAFELAALGGAYWTTVDHASGWWVCCDGRIASTRHGSARVLKPIRVGRYLAVGRHGHDRKYVHHIVCEAFQGPRPEGAQVRHIDGNPHNNAAANLRWGTPAENAADKEAHGTDNRGSRNAMARLDAAAVEELRRLRRSAGWSYRRLAEHAGVSAMTAFRAVVGQSWGAR